MSFLVGLDLGQRQDPSAIVVLEREKVVEDTGKVWAPADELELPPQQVSKYSGTMLQRFEQGTTYPDIVERVAALFCEPKLENQTLVPDWTGVGIAVLDMLRRAKRDPVRCPKCKGNGTTGRESTGDICKTCKGNGKILLKAKLRPVYITAGARWSIKDDGFHVAKSELVSVLHVLLQANPGRLEFDKKLSWTKTVSEELKNFKSKITDAGNETFAAWREKEHDDLVLATAIACWVGERGSQKFWMR